MPVPSFLLISGIFLLRKEPVVLSALKWPESRNWQGRADNRHLNLKSLINHDST